MSTEFKGTKIRKTIKRFIKIALWTIGLFVLLTIGFATALQFKPVQSWASQRVAAFLSKELNAQIRIQSLYFKPFTSLTVEGLYMSDQLGDTLLFAQRLETQFDLTKIFRNQISIHQAKLKNASFHLKTLPSGESNLKFALDYFAKSPDTKSTKVLLEVSKLTLENLNFTYDNQRKSQPHLPGVMDFDNLEASEIFAEFHDMDFKDGTFTGQVKNMKLHEKSGFMIRDFTSHLSLGAHHIQLSDLTLQTNRSILRETVRMEFQEYGDFENFMSAVNLEWTAENAHIHSKDIEFFAPEMTRVQFETTFSGYVMGTVSDFTADIANLKLGEVSALSGKAHVHGLPHIETTWFDSQINSLHTNSSEIEQITAGFTNNPKFKLPLILYRLGDLVYQGSWNGHYHDFDLNGILQTDLGNLQSDLHFNIAPELEYKGLLVAEEFELGTFLNRDEFKAASISVQLDAKGLAINTLAGHFTAQIPFLDFHNYRYKNLEIDGRLGDQLAEAQIKIEDPGLQMQLDGAFNYKEVQKEGWAKIKLDQLNPERLTWLNTDRNLKITIEEIDTHFSFTELQDLHGHLSLKNSDLQINNQSFHIQNFELTAQEVLQNQKSVILKSDVLNANLDGKVAWMSLKSFGKSLIFDQLPSYSDSLTNLGDQHFAFNIELLNAEPILRLMNENLHINPSARLKGVFSSDKMIGSHLEGTFPRIQYGEYYAENITIEASKFQNTGIQASLKSQNLGAFNTLHLHSLSIEQYLKNQQVRFQINLSADSAGANLVNLTGGADLMQSGQANIWLEPSSISINKLPWKLGEHMRFRWMENQIEVENFEISHQQQKLLANGIISKDPDQKLNFDFQQFDISLINPFLADQNISLGGVLQGSTQIHALLENPYALANIQVSNLSLNQYLLGHLNIVPDFDQTKNLVHINMGLQKDQIPKMDLKGTFNFLKKEDQLDLTAKFDGLEISFLESLLSGLVANVKGKISGESTVKGNWKNPEISGTGFSNDIHFTVNYLGTPYRFSGPFLMDNTKMIFKDIALYDPRGQRAMMNGSIDLNSIRAPFIDAKINAQDFLVLNTTLKDNPLYYGTAYGTGNFNFVGRPMGMQIDIQAKTEENTYFHIPLNYSSSLGETEFIRFVTAEEKNSDLTATSTLNQNQKSDFAKGLVMNMDLQVSPSAETKITTDLGELTGRGEGQISLKISSLGDFEMFGDYRINTGKFNFSAQDFINKIFEIRQGGNIRWTGRPTEATINLTAFYEQRTNLSALYNAAGRPSNEQRVLAQAEMLLNGNLLRPQIQFGLNFPNDPYVKDELQSYLSDANNVNQQTLSLIVRRSFMPASTQDFSRELNSTLLGAGTEIAFNQLNNILSESLNLNFMDFHIRSLNDASASFRLFKDRLIFSGGISDRRTEQLNDLNVFSNRIATDAELRYLIRTDGRLILRASNKLNTRHFLLNPTDDYISAFGLIYRQEFNAFDEFFNRMLLFNRRRNNQKEEQSPKN